MEELGLIPEGVLNWMALMAGACRKMM